MDPMSLFGGAPGAGGGSGSLMWGILLGIVGLAYFSYGKKLAKPVPLGCGLGLMVFPYFVTDTTWMLGIGGVLGIAPFFFRG